MKACLPLFGAVTLAACTTGQQAADQAGEFTTTGRYRYIDGDRLIRSCPSGQACEETLVRDDRLQREVERSPDFEATLRVRRISACGPRSSQVACVTSEDGTALEIIRWLEIRRPPPSLGPGGRTPTSFDNFRSDE